MLRKLLGSLLLTGLVGIVGVAKAAVIMDATTHNGSFLDGTYGIFWSDGAGNPPGWSKTGRFAYNGAYGQYIYNDTQLTNNTGELITANSAYTLAAAIGDHLDNRVDVYVRATQNADGTGASADLAHVFRVGTTAGHANFSSYTVTDTGAPAAASLDGYYIQVRVETGSIDDSFYYWINSVSVTSAPAVPEPASLGALAIGSSMMLARRRRI